jgi:hypothetical protein
LLGADAFRRVTSQDRIQGRLDGCEVGNAEVL